MSESVLGKRFHHHASLCTFPILYRGPRLVTLIKFNKTKNKIKAGASFPPVEGEAKFL